MHSSNSWVRFPVRREGAEHYLQITLLSFAASVTLTRLFLEITGYPQLGDETYHIAHVLWGGLVLFAASLLPLIYANRWVYSLIALLSGIGMGLFIDEVGKFITQSNDYFNPLAAPIIYALFMLTVLLYYQVRKRPSRGAREELYRAFDAMEEVLDHDLDEAECAALTERLRYVAQEAKQAGQPEFSRLAEDLLRYLESESITVRPVPTTFWRRVQGRWQRFENKYLNEPVLKVTLAGSLLALGLMGLARMAQALPVSFLGQSLERTVDRFLNEGLISTSDSVGLIFARAGLESFVGLLLLVSAGEIAGCCFNGICSNIKQFHELASVIEDRVDVQEPKSFEIIVPVALEQKIISYGVFKHQPHGMAVFGNMANASIEEL